MGKKLETSIYNPASFKNLVYNQPTVWDKPKKENITSTKYLFFPLREVDLFDISDFEYLAPYVLPPLTLHEVYQAILRPS